MLLLASLEKSYKSKLTHYVSIQYSVIYYHRSFVEMGLQDETRVRVWLAAISPLPKNRQIFGDPDRPHAKLVRLILSECSGKQLLYYQKHLYNNAAKIFGIVLVNCIGERKRTKPNYYNSCPMTM